MQCDRLSCSGNGQCIKDGRDGFICTCDPGYDGKVCENSTYRTLTSIVFVITPRLCLGNSYQVENFDLIMLLDPCDIWNRKNVTCKHDGNCIIKKTLSSANASCECAKGFHGEHCEIRNDKIESNLKANFI